MKLRLSIAIALVLSTFAIGVPGASAGSSAPNDDTVICKAKIDGKDARYALVAGDVVAANGCRVFSSVWDSSDGGFEKAWFSYQATCANDGAFYTELCESDAIKVLDASDMVRPAGKDGGDKWSTDCNTWSYYYGWGNYINTDCWIKAVDL